MSAYKPKRIREASEAPRKCNARRRNGHKCKQPAGFGTDHVGYGPCKSHGGTTSSHKIKAARDMALHNALVMGVPFDDIDPMDAILTCIKISAGEVVYCSQRIEELDEDEAVVTGEKNKSHSGGLDGDWEEVEETNDAQLNIWIRARHNAMERVVKFSKAAIDAGISERQVKVAESTGQAIGQLLHNVMAELNLSDAQKDLAPHVIQKNLMLLEAGER